MEILNHFSNLVRLHRKSVLGRAAALCIALILGNSLAAAMPEQSVDEYQVKAAFVYNFAKFVRWPAGSFQSPNEPIAICILGQDPFGHWLDDAVAGRAIEGRSLIVRHIPTIGHVAGCHVLFIGSAGNRRMSSMLADLKTPGILTIGDSDAAVEDGIVISFRLEGGKVRFEINVEAGDREKLQISSRLLSLARVAEPNRK